MISKGRSILHHEKNGVYYLFFSTKCISCLSAPTWAINAVVCEDKRERRKVNCVTLIINPSYAHLKQTAFSESSLDIMRFICLKKIENIKCM